MTSILLAELAQQRLVAVMISLTTLDDELKRIMEPRAAAPAARLRAIRVLRDNRIPVGVLCSPMIPMINDMELEHSVGRSQGGRRTECQLHAATPAARSGATVRGVVAGALPAARRACAQSDPPEPWRRVV